MSVFQSLSLLPAIGVFAVAAFVILVVGTRLTTLADVLADRTGLGEAVTGAVLLGATTSLSGTVTSVTSAYAGNVDLSYANALGGIAAQTAFLAIADMVYRRANLEHAAASAANLSQASLLILLLCVPLIAAILPPVTVFAIHPASIVLVAVYVVGVRLAMRDREEPMWEPKDTRETRTDTPDEDSFAGPTTGGLWVRFAVYLVLIGCAGWVVARTGAVIADRSGLSGSVVGALMTATVTSLPELVTTVAAVRRGALQLAVGGIIGGNTFDVLFLSISDVAYRDGSIYNAIGDDARMWAIVGILMTSILLLGLIRRERHGPGNIGVESASLLLVYVGAAVAAFFVV